MQHIKVYEKIDGDSLCKAWRLVIESRLKECLEMTEKNGPGAVIYKFLPQDGDNTPVVQDLDETPVPNCQMYFIPHTQDAKNPAWDMFFSEVVDDTISKYDSQKHILVSVNVPTQNDVESTIGSTKLFLKETLISVL